MIQINQGDFVSIINGDDVFNDIYIKARNQLIVLVHMDLRLTLTKVYYCTARLLHGSF